MRINDIRVHKKGFIQIITSFVKKIKSLFEIDNNARLITSELCPFSPVLMFKSVAHNAFILCKHRDGRKL